MEVMYNKLHDKYEKLKKRRFSELEQYNNEQNTKFINYLSAAEGLIDHLKNENSGLHALVNEFKAQTALNRSDIQNKFEECQNLLIEENAKAKELSAELERLRNQVAERFQCNNKDDDNDNMQLESFSGVHRARSSSLSVAISKDTIEPQRRHYGIQTENADLIPNANGTKEHVVIKPTVVDTLSNYVCENSCQLDCSRRCVPGSGNGVEVHDHASCMFQILLEFVAGMKFSVLNQTRGLQVLHPSSGYSFNLTWLNEAVDWGEEVEIRYHVVSLGTLERIAHEWMKEDIVFSMSMFSIFFERLCKVTRLCG